MIKGFIMSIFMSVAGASLALAQAPDVSPTNPSPYGSPSTERIRQAGAAVQEGEAQPAPSSSGVLDGQGRSCDDGSCQTGGKVCGPPGRVWVGAEYLLWWVKDARLPSLVTTGSAVPTQIPPPGALGGLGTVGLFAGEGVDRDPFSGGRFTAGYWLDCGQTKGIEASYFFLGSRSKDFTSNSSGAPGSRVLARPFFDVSSGLPNAELIAFPGLASGTDAVHSTTRLQGPEAKLISNICCSCGDCGDCDGPARSYRVDLIGGFRYLDLREGLGVVENTQILPASPLFAPADIRAFDQIDTRNQFYGGAARRPSRGATEPSVRQRHGQARSRRHPPDRRYQRRNDDHPARRAGHRQAGRPAGSSEQHRPLLAGRVLGRPGRERQRRLSGHGQLARLRRLHLRLLV